MFGSLRVLTSTPSCLVFVLLIIPVNGHGNSTIFSIGEPEWKHSLRGNEDKVSDFMPPPGALALIAQMENPTENVTRGDVLPNEGGLALIAQMENPTENVTRGDVLPNEGYFEIATNVLVLTYWKIIYNIEHGSNAQVTDTIMWTTGFRKLHREEHTITTTHSFGLNLNIEGKIPIKVNKASVSADGTSYLSVGGGTTYTFNHASQKLTMTENEIYSSEVRTKQLIIPPNTFFRVWQLAADVGGEEICFQYFVTSENKSYIPPPEQSQIQVQRKREITVSTPFRLKHAEKGLYMIIIRRKFWPAADLSRNPNYYFNYSPAHAYNGDNNYRIITKNSTDTGYIAMYSSEAGGIYFDRSTGNPKQLWKIGKSLPLYFGDRITLRNAYFPTASLCYHQGESTTVYCLNNKEEEWIMC